MAGEAALKVAGFPQGKGLASGPNASRAMRPNKKSSLCGAAASGGAWTVLGISGPATGSFPGITTPVSEFDRIKFTGPQQLLQWADSFIRLWGLQPE